MTTPTSTPGTIALNTLEELAAPGQYGAEEAVTALADLRALMARCEQAEARAKAWEESANRLADVLTESGTYRETIGDLCFCRATRRAALAAWRDRGSK
jgi:hypothetical protein